MARGPGGRWYASNCTECYGTGLCTLCGGIGDCQYCHYDGRENCVDCDGTGSCSLCGGSCLCGECGGEGFIWLDKGSEALGKEKAW